MAGQYLKVKGEHVGLFGCVGAMTLTEIAERLALDAAWGVLIAAGVDLGDDDDFIAGRLAELARGRMVTRERIRQIEQDALRKLNRKRGAMQAFQLAGDLDRARDERIPVESLRRRILGTRTQRQDPSIDNAVRCMEESEAA